MQRDISFEVVDYKTTFSRRFIRRVKTFRLLHSLSIALSVLVT